MTPLALESMQTCGVHYDAAQTGVLETAFRPRYSGFHPANSDEATTAILQRTPQVCMLPTLSGMKPWSTSQRTSIRYTEIGRMREN
jgi:hypothetical protein